MKRKRRNRRDNGRLNVNTNFAVHIGAVIAALFVVAILNVLAASNCTHLKNRIGEAEKELARLEDARNREATRWEEMKTPEKVSEALLRHGLAMKPPRPEQNVRMKMDGQPYPGQLSVRMAQNRTTGMPVASVATRSKTAKKVR